MEPQFAHPQAPQTISIRHCRMTYSDTAPKLDEPCDSTDSIPSKCRKTFFSYDWCRMHRQQKFLAAHQSRLPAKDAPTGHFTFSLKSLRKIAQQLRPM